MCILFTFISVIWLEVSNILLSNTGTAVNIFGMLTSAAAAALVLCAVTNIIPLKKNKKWIHLFLIELLVFFFIIEHFTVGAYTVYMSPSDIAGGAKNVATGYGDIVIDIIKNGVFDIAIMHVPFLAALALNIFKKDWCGKEYEPVKAMGCTVMMLFFLSIGASVFENSSSKATYTYGYSYDNAAKELGISTAVMLDVKYAAAGVPAAPAIEIAENIEEAEPEPEAVDLAGIFKGKNLILITAESFTKELAVEEINPTIYRLMNNGIVVEDFYQPAWGGSTSTGEASILMGIIPTNSTKTIQTVVGKSNDYTIANQLKALGYKTIAMHNGDCNYYSRQKTHIALGYDEWIACGTGMDITYKLWPRSDKEMMDFSVQLFKDDAPFCVYYMTISGHCRYSWQGNNMAKKHKEYIQEKMPEAVERIQAYYACNYDLELGLESLLSQLTEAGELENTVIVMTGDHYPYGLTEGATYDNERNFLEDLFGYDTDRIDRRDHNGLVIWSPCIEELEEPVVVEEPCYSPDILPTLLYLFGIEYDEADYTGRNIFSDTEGIAVWINGSWKTSKGFYDAASKTFDGDADQEYVEYETQRAAAKISQSRERLK